jgi:hypothetical protein
MMRTAHPLVAGEEGDSLQHASYQDDIYYQYNCAHFIVKFAEKLEPEIITIYNCNLQNMFYIYCGQSSCVLL